MGVTPDGKHVGNEALAAVERIAASHTFERAGRAIRLLRHVVGMAAAGRSEEIKEYNLAVDVFDRATYDPKVDSLVRVEAGRLRKLLALYYETEGRDEAIRIEIPKGTYAPVVHNVAVAAEIPPVEEPPAAVAAPPRYGVRLAVSAVLVLLAGAAVWVGTAGLRRPGVYPSSGPLALAVLPFVDLSPGKDRGYISDGLTEEVIEVLSAIDGLNVTSRTSAFAYKGKNLDVRRIGQELKVRAVLEGSVRPQGDRIRITLQLINTEDGFHLWSDSFDREVSDVLAMEKEIAASVSKTFNLVLRGTTRALLRPRPRNTEAWHYYLRAASLFGTGELDDQVKAIALFQSAVATDPGYAMAWAKLANVLTTRVEWGLAQGVDVLPTAADAARRAVALDPNLAEAHFADGLVKIYQDRDWPGAERAFRRAIELDPNDGLMHYQFARLVLSPTGRFAEAIEQYQRCLALDSRDVPTLDGLASAYIQIGRCAEADEHLATARTLSARAPAPLVYQGMAAECKGQHEEALAKFREAASRLRSGWVLGHLAQHLTRMGRREEAGKLLAEMQAPAGGAPVPHLDIAAVYAVMGDKEHALASLEQASATISSELIWVNVDNRFESLRSEPRFVALLRKNGFDQATAR